MIQLTPDEIAAAVLARQRRGPWAAVLPGLTWLLWLLAAGLTAHTALDYPPRFRHFDDLRVTPVLKVPDKPDFHEPAADAPKVPGGAVTLVYGPRPADREQARPLTVQERFAEHSYREGQRGQALVWAVERLLTVVAAVVLALLSTVALLTASRRATMRQVQASLAAIAGQLAALSKSPAG